MMFNESFIQQLKKTNISVDAEKTRQRVKTLWQGATKEQREELLALSGLGRATVQRVYTTGIISAKLVVAMAQVLEIDPNFIIGRTDEPSHCEEDTLKAMLTELKYSKLLAQYQNRTPYRKRATRKAPPEAAATEQQGMEVLPFPQQKELLDALTEEEMVLLLRSVLLKARAGGPYENLALQIKQLLLS